MSRIRLRRSLAVVCALAAIALAGCAPAPVASTQAGTIGLLLPEAGISRYETSDRPTFEDTVAKRCPDCELLYANANSSAARQQEQAEAMLARGADVLVIDAVDTVAAESVVAAATRSGATVVAYDRFIDHPDVAVYVSFDSELIGRLQADAVVDALPQIRVGETAGLLLLHGSPTDPNAAALRAGVHDALQDADVEVLGEFDVPAWSATEAQEWVAGQLAQHPGRIDGVVAANDALAGGAIAALKAAGIDPMPPVSGQDGELSAIQRIVAGDQLMTVAKATDDQARTAAEVAVRLLRGEEPAAPGTRDGISSFLLAPTSVWRDDIERVIIQGRVHSADAICTPPYADACAQLGLTDRELP
ncbi:substrate-binding domain-containing protein [Microbacterium aquimaris]|uniref:Substrate-binding domain-containing protein n=1 Tax=Microbacterium aquimaris TaxID=459816 RepID=A0ABU5N2G2_9MICO|nr:substrate-binding domain-containing protein [Microbacterium aquimaris]MDZ8160276.1 substrate-binding domain-containing protein [Microbacterium aquimaris]